VEYSVITNNPFKIVSYQSTYNTKVVYPFYCFQVKNHFYMFHHGHLTSSLVLGGKKGIKEARDVEELESMAHSIIYTLWGTSAKEDFIKRQWRLIKEWGYLYPYGIYQNVRESLTSRIWPSNVGTYYQIDAQGVDEREPEDIAWFIKRCNVPKLIPDPQDIEFHYVCGHTHIGGRIGASRQKCFIETEKGKKYINLWNTGGWICPEGIFPPYAFIFYVRNDGSPGRYLLLPSKFQTSQYYYNPNVLIQHGMVKNYID
ncbi:MAG TPA: hypothetical protein ACFYEM_02455, partial [Candidatus Hypogeohydataceae bacterium YC40]